MQDTIRGITRGAHVCAIEGKPGRARAETVVSRTEGTCTLDSDKAGSRGELKKVAAARTERSGKPFRVTTNRARFIARGRPATMT